MRKLYESTYYFWVLVRIAIMCILIYGLYEAFNSGFRMPDEAMYWNGATAVYVFLLFLLLVKADEHFKLLRLVVGILSLVFATFLLYIFYMDFSYEGAYLLAFFSAALTGLGLFDVLGVQRAVQDRNNAEPAETEPAERTD